MKPVTVIRIILVLNVVITVAAMTLAYRALHRADESERLVIRSHKTLQAAEETLRRVVDAETWERGYLLTRAPADLAAFQRALQLAGTPMDGLATILIEDGRGVDAERLHTQISSTLAALERLVEHVRAGGAIAPEERAS